MDELLQVIRNSYSDLENTIYEFSNIDEVLIFTNENNIDLISYFHSYLRCMLWKISIADGVVREEEVEFINTVLGPNSNNDYEYDNELFITVMAENNTEVIDDILNNPVVTNIMAKADKNLATSAINAIYELGLCFISIDGHNDIKEIAILNEIIEIMNHGVLENTNEEKNLVDNKEEDIELTKELSFDSLLDELQSLIGLDNVKQEVISLANLVKVRQLRLEHNLPTPPMSFHLVFTGNPGTGKTTIARLLAKIYQSLGLLSKGHLIEVDRSGLVAGYMGQTAIKASEVIQNSLGGVLFIDEAYTLTSNQDSSDYGSEAIDTVLKAMEDYRDDLIIIVAGYTDKMDSFLNSNPGLKSRFNKYVHFSDYTEEELANIFLTLCKKSDYKITEEAKKSLLTLISFLDKNRGDNFGNGREIRNKFETVLKNQANRIMTISNLTTDDLQTITVDDILPLLPSIE